MSRINLVLAACCMVMMQLVTAPSLGASNNLSHTMYLTFNRSVRLPGVTLAPGTYIFELADPMSTSLVRVLSRDRRTAYLLAFTLRVDRPRGVPADQPVSFGEAPAGSPPPIIAWYHSEGKGQEFVYPEKR